MRTVDIYLLRALRAQQTCDRGAVVSGIREFVLAQSLALRGVRFVLERESLSVLVGAVFRFVVWRAASSVRMPTSIGSVLAVARQPNEWRAIGQVASRLNRGECSTIDIHHIPWRFRSAHRPADRRTRRRLLRIARRLLRRDGAFHAVRSLELAVFYCRFREALVTSPAKVALISTHSNPHGIALHASARSVGLPVALVTHGMPIVPLAPLDYDLALMECRDSVESYLQEGCVLRRVVIRGRRDGWTGLSVIPERPIAVGVFLSKDPVPGVTERVVKALLRQDWVREVILRPHPVNLWRGLGQRVRSFGSSRIRIVSDIGLREVFEQCDLAVASNSTIHVDALLAGVPSVYLHGGDHAPFDVQGFVAGGLLYQWLTEADPLNLEHVRRFYQRAEWEQSLRRFANVDTREDDVISAFGRALVQLTTLKDACA